MNFSGQESDNQSDSGTQHIDYENPDLSREPGINMAPGPSELDSLQSQVEAMKSEMTLNPLQSKFLESKSEFACSICMKGFLNDSDLKYHQRTHERGKFYSCDICHKQFSRKFNMVTHRQLHSEVRQHCCKLCLKGFTRRDRLFMHYHSHHRTELGIGNIDIISLKKLTVAVDGLP